MIKVFARLAGIITENRIFLPKQKEERQIFEMSIGKIGI